MLFELTRVRGKGHVGPWVIGAALAVVLTGCSQGTGLVQPRNEPSSVTPSPLVPSKAEFGAAIQSEYSECAGKWETSLDGMEKYFPPESIEWVMGCQSSVGVFGLAEKKAFCTVVLSAGPGGDLEILAASSSDVVVQDLQNDSARMAELATSSGLFDVTTYREWCST